MEAHPAPVAADISNVSKSIQKILARQGGRIPCKEKQKKVEAQENTPPLQHAMQLHGHLEV